MRDSGVLRIDPAFRLIALAERPIINSSSGQWLNSELLSLFLFHEMRPLDKHEEIHIVRSKVFDCYWTSRVVFVVSSISDFELVLIERSVAVWRT